MPMLNSLVGLNQQGVIATMWREFQEPDEMTSDLELLSGFTKMTEQASKALEEQVRYDLKEAFGRDLKEHETYSLTQALLYTDLSSLLTFKDEQITNIDYVMDLLKNPEHINEEIKKIHNILYSQIKHDGQFNWYINSAKSLANQMVTNVGHEGTVLNARAIAEGSMTGKSYETTDAIVDLIDRLTTLYALSETDISDLNVVSKLNAKGIENMLRTHYIFKKETSESQVIDKIHTMKGYTKLIMDEAIDIRYGRIEDKADFESLGNTMAKPQKFKCPFCGKIYATKNTLYTHLEKEHHDRLGGLSPAHYYFNFRNKKTQGTCIICGKPTPFNEKTEKYDRLDSLKCREAYRQQFKDRMKKKYGKTTLLGDPKQQKKMLEARRISGTYTWRDGTQTAIVTGKQIGRAHV